MFDFDAGKFIIIGIVALIVIGPKELPRVMRQAGQAAAKMRRMAAEFRGQFMDAMREAGVDDIKADVTKLAESAKTDAGIDPLAQIKTELTQALDAAGRPAPLPGAGVPTIV
ncbi:MAG: twin-arginine translocase TatA/TatE family subunit, partial [Methylocella sp.]